MVPLVSIIIPTYSRAHVLSGALDSLLYQQYPRTEIIVERLRARIRVRERERERSVRRLKLHLRHAHAHF
jgi:GT2 family glycosyltransferase